MIDAFACIKGACLLGSHIRGLAQNMEADVPSCPLDITRLPSLACKDCNTYILFIFLTTQVPRHRCLKSSEAWLRRLPLESEGECLEEIDALLKLKKFPKTDIPYHEHELRSVVNEEILLQVIIGVTIPQANRYNPANIEKATMSPVRHFRWPTA